MGKSRYYIKTDTKVKSVTRETIKHGITTISNEDRFMTYYWVWDSYLDQQVPNTYTYHQFAGTDTGERYEVVRRECAELNKDHNAYLKEVQSYSNG